MMHRFGSLTFLMAGSIVVASALAWFVFRDDAASAAGPEFRVRVHCAAGIKGPVTAIAEEYERKFGSRVELTFGGSGTLLGALTVRNHGEVYIAGDDSYVSTAKERGIVEEILEIATMRPVLAVPRGNPKSVTGFRDLLRQDLRVGLGTPDAAAVGKIAMRTAKDLGIWAELEKQVTVLKPTVNELGNDLAIGSIDVAVIWDSTARQYDKIEIVDDPELSKHVRHVTLGVLRNATLPRTALHFARYLTARDGGLEAFRTHGFLPIGGDAWNDHPRLELMSGAMLRPAVEATITAFEEREGVEVHRVYNGCGILVSQMKAGSVPDAYFSCDASFLADVQDQFLEGTTVSQNDIVILVPTGNPKGIATLADLLRAGVRVGLGHPTKSALGALTASLLQRAGHHDALKSSGNVVVESATGDLLVNQLCIGSLDAALVYTSNAAHVSDRCDVIPLDEDGGNLAAQATQPFAIAKRSKYPILMGRLLDAIRGAASRQRFEELGFEWQADGRTK